MSFDIVKVRKNNDKKQEVQEKKENGIMQNDNLKYFCTEDKRQGTCYHEFQKGKWDQQSFWKEDSLLLSDDMFFELGLKSLFKKAIQGYDPYGPVEVSKEQWAMLLTAADGAGGAKQEALQEADAWVQECFATEEVFTILGI